MQSKAVTVAEYLAELPEDRRRLVSALRTTIRKHLDKRVKEGVQYGHIGYAVPHSLYPPGYHCDPKQPLPVVSIGSQKGHVGIYLFCLYTDPGELERFAKAWKATGKRLDMGKSCVRVKRLEDVPMEVLADTISRVDADEFVRTYEAGLAASGVKHPGKKDLTPAGTLVSSGATKARPPRSKKPSAATGTAQSKSDAQTGAPKTRAPKTPATKSKPASKEKSSTSAAARPRRKV